MEKVLMLLVAVLVVLAIVLLVIVVVDIAASVILANVCEQGIMPGLLGETP